jgi:hypothetical protein
VDREGKRRTCAMRVLLKGNKGRLKDRVPTLT